MITNTINKAPKNIVEITSNVTSDELRIEAEKVIVQLVAEAELPGFRKGKAPRDLVEKQLDKTKVASLVVQNILPRAYEKAITEYSLKPIVDPKVEILDPKDRLDELLTGRDLKVKILICERPEIKLNDYQNQIKAETAKSAIWTPGQDEKKLEEDKPEVKEQKKFVKIVDVLLKVCQVDLADLVIETEINHLLSQTLAEIKKLGLSLDEYLRNTGKTADDLKKDAHERATSSLKLSFIFDEIARLEGIKVEKADIDAIIGQIQNPAQKKQAQENSYQLAPVLLRQKVVDFLMKL